MVCLVCLGDLVFPRRIMMAHSLNLAVREAVPASLVLERASPIALAKALKNDAELKVREVRKPAFFSIFSEVQPT